jgi:hypothetical protein
MTDYTKATNFATKDALPSGNPAKIVKGTEIDTEFNNVAIAVATKSNSASPTFTGTLTAPALSITGNTVLGNDASDTITFTGDVASNILPSADDTYDLGATASRWKDIYIDGVAYVDAINFAGTGITATAAEINILDGVTATFTELNLLDGVTSTTAELNILDGVTATAAEINVLDGITATVAELNILDGVTATAAELNYTDGVTSNIQTQIDALQDLDADLTAIAALTPTDGNFIVGNGSAWVAESGNTVLASVGVTATATELNILDGVTATFTELNLLDGVTSTTAELNILDGVTSTTAELNILDGVTSTAAELNILDGVTATAAELNILDGVTSTFTELNLLDGVTATTAELNYVDGVTSNIQTQLDALQDADADLTAIGALAKTDGNFIVGNGSTWVAEAGATVLASIGVTATLAEVNIMDGVTSTTAELNILDGVTATTAELNYLDITALGTTEASKAVTTDASNNIATTGTLASGNLAVTGNQSITSSETTGNAFVVADNYLTSGVGINFFTASAGFNGYGVLSRSNNASATGIAIGAQIDGGTGIGLKVINYGTGNGVFIDNIGSGNALSADGGNIVLTNGQYIEEYAATGTSGAVTINLNTGNNFSTALAGVVTYTFSNPATSGTVSSFTLKVVNNGSAITWPASVDWPAGTAPTLSASGATDVFVFYTHDGGTTWYGFTAGQAMA